MPGCCPTACSPGCAPTGAAGATGNARSPVRAGAERIFVAEAAAGAGARRVVGFAGGGPARRAATGHAGEVYTLYVEDDFHGLGIGRALFSALAAGLARDLGPSLVVWVLAGNPARFFYEALGGRPAGRRLGTLGGQAIEELAYGWSGAAVPVHLRG